MVIEIKGIPIFYLCPYPLTPSPFLGEGFRVRAAKLGCIHQNILRVVLPLTVVGVGHRFQ
ncbi:MAG: hypothetical protein EBV05_10530 [Cyanobacteria bacterium WB6_1B_304]|nr:hypothetical protein [Cyanobacteria bacterium WB6_1B_304]